MTQRKPVFALVDCNNFFVSCERVFRPDLWNKPVAVLSNNDACIVARSNEVKQMGVPMGAPLFKIDHLMKGKDVTLFSANFRLYGDFSQRVVQILMRAAPSIEVYSVDESFLEISSLPTDDYETWAAELRAQVLQWTGIPVSIGVAHTKTLAKAASEFAKLNAATGGVHAVLTDETRETLLRWLPIKDVWGVGRALAPKLLARGVSTAYVLTQVSEQWAQQQMSIRGLKTVRELKGESCLPIETEVEPQQTIARTRSFGHNVRDYYQLEGAIATFTAQAAVKLRAQTSVATGVMVFLRTPHGFEGRGSSTVVRLVQPSSDTGTLITAALQGLQQVYDPDFAYRRAGVGLVGLSSEEAWQLSLLDKSADIDKQALLMRSVDALNKKHNLRLLRHGSEHISRTGWHSKHQRRSPAYTTNWNDLRVVR